jgi:hypothetical protein
MEQLRMKIPSPIIGLLSDIFSKYYTHAELDRLFLNADAPEEDFDGNKLAKVLQRLKTTNRLSDSPLDVLGSFIEDFLELAPENISRNSSWNGETRSDLSEALVNNQSRIKKALGKVGLSYQTGGLIGKNTASPTASLSELVSLNGLSAVQTEIDRALQLVTDDPNGAAQFAANALEAVFKAYLTKRSIWFDEETDTLNGLWSKVHDSLGLNPKDMVAKDLQKIASGLNCIVDGTMYMRNKRSGAHGKSEEQANKARIRPRHARLVIHSSHSLAAYIIECMEGD